MAQTFSIGENVMVMTYEDRRRGNNSYAMYEVEGFYNKTSSYSRFNNDKYTQIFIPQADDYEGPKLPALTGPYVKVIKRYEARTCSVCTGTGKILPEGFSETASYRKACTNCDGTGTVTPLQDYKLIINRKDKVMKMRDYQPIADAKERTEQAQKTAEQARKDRVTNGVHNLLDAAQEALTTDNPQLALAKYLLSHNLEEIRNAAYRVKKIAENGTCRECAEPAEWRDPASDGPIQNVFCYQHYQAAAEAHRSEPELSLEDAM